jgi:hypothetical protein
MYGTVPYLVKTANIINSNFMLLTITKTLSNKQLQISIPEPGMVE